MSSPLTKPPPSATPEALFEAAIDPRRTPGRRLRDRVVRTWRLTWARMIRLGGISDGNLIDVFVDGDEAFDAMFHALDGATRRIWFETYIYEADSIGDLVKEKLVAAAERGCEVVLLYDQWGSVELPSGYFQALKDAGGKVVAFNPVSKLISSKASPLVRDHRKVLIVDDEIAFCGGMNVSEDYAGARLGKATFRDTHAALRGPAVSHLGDIFLESFRLATDERWRPERRDPGTHPEGVLVQVLRSNVLLKRTQIQRAIRQTVRRSVERCWITTPYFIPPARLIRQLIRAAKRGVDVRILTAGKSDVPVARRASEHIYGRLLKAGVKIYEMRKTTLHAKTTVIDGVYLTVGSFNLDYWSFRRNLEVNVAVVDPRLAEELERQYETDLEGSEEINWERWQKRSLLRRMVNWLAYHLAKI